MVEEKLEYSELPKDLENKEELRKDDKNILKNN